MEIGERGEVGAQPVEDVAMRLFPEAKAVRLDERLGGHLLKGGVISEDGGGGYAGPAPALRQDTDANRRDRTLLGGVDEEAEVIRQFIVSIAEPRAIPRFDSAGTQVAFVPNFKNLLEVAGC